MSTHVHSVQSYYDGLVEDFPRRTQDILIALQHLGQATDRQIMEALELTDPNGVRPRITEAIQQGLLVECGAVRDRISGKRVRLVAIAADPRFTQQEMAL
jgi:hypothetical protein